MQKNANIKEEVSPYDYNKESSVQNLETYNSNCFSLGTDSGPEMENEPTFFTPGIENKELKNTDGRLCAKMQDMQE